MSMPKSEHISWNSMLSLGRCKAVGELQATDKVIHKGLSYRSRFLVGNGYAFCPLRETIRHYQNVSVSGFGEGEGFKDMY